MMKRLHWLKLVSTLLIKTTLIQIEKHQIQVVLAIQRGLLAVRMHRLIREHSTMTNQLNKLVSDSKQLNLMD